MAAVTTGYSWSNEQITPALLNQMWTSSTFNASAVDESTTALSGGAVIVRDGGVTAGKLATTLDLSSNNLTFPSGGIVQGEVDTATKAEMEGESAAGICVPATLKNHPGVAKCYGVVTYDTSTPAFSGGYNVASVSEVSGEDERRITFTNRMANANYVIHITAEREDDEKQPYILHRTTTHFDIHGNAGDTSFVKLHFTVFGQLE